MSKSLDKFLKNPTQVIDLYKEVIKQPSKFVELINTKENIEISLLFIAIASVISCLFSALFSPFFGLSFIIWAPIMSVVFVCIGCGVFHLLRNFLEAQGGFTDYVAMTAWYVVLTLPIQVGISLTSPFFGLGGLSSLASTVVFFGWFYCYFKKFNSSVAKTVGVAAGLILITSVPMMMMMAATSFYKMAAASGPNGENFIEEVQKLQKLQAAAYDENYEQSEAQSERKSRKKRAKKRRERTPAEEAQRDCEVMKERYAFALKQVYITEGKAERDKMKKDLKKQITAQHKRIGRMIAKAGGEKALLERASEFPEEKGKYEAFIESKKCHKRLVSELKL